MDNRELERYTTTDRKLRPFFRGVFARNSLPAELLPGAYIINTKNSNRAGEHWVSLWVNNDASIEFMDPLGKHPRTYGWRYSEPCTHNRQAIQPHQSVLCGAYCLYFLYYRSRGGSMRDIIQSMLPLTSRNDDLVKIFLEALTRID